MTTTHTRPAEDPANPVDSRTRLVLAAAALVHAESYNVVGVKAICDRAEVQRGSFYHFFESKQALMLEALDAIWERYRSNGLATLQDPTLPPRGRIESMYEATAASQRRYKESTGHVLGCTFGNLAAEASTLDDAIRCRVGTIFDAWLEILEDPLTEAGARGEVDPDIPPEAAACEVLSDLQGLLLVAKVRNDPEIIASGGRVIGSRLWGWSAGDTNSRTEP